jgi:hypothetical protein
MARKMMTVGALLATAALLLPGCATVASVNWAYNRPSIFEPPPPEAEHVALRAIVGLPLIVGSVGWDALTFPFQLAFGVWPWWGDGSTQLRPPTQSAAD